MRKPSLVGALIAGLAAVLLVAAGGTTAAPVSNGYLIGAAAPLTSAQVAQLESAGVSLKYVYENFGGAAAVMNARTADRVRQLAFVTSVSEDTVKQPDGSTVTTAASPLPDPPYWHDLIDAEQNTTYTGDGVWVAVLDTGFYPNWRDYLAPAKILADKARAFNAAGANENPNQWEAGSDPHGMTVSATIVGYTLADDLNEGGWGTGYATGAAGTYDHPGVAPDAKIIPVKVCEPIGCFGSAINAAVDYVTSLKRANPSQPIVINMSLGGSQLDATEKAALDAAIGAGVVVVASAGNSGVGGMGFPGAYEPVVSVGAGTWRDQWNGYPDKTWWLDDVPENGVDEVYINSFSSREKPGQYLDVISTGASMLLPYPCAMLYKDGQVSNGTLHRTCASKASPDNASAAPFQYLFINGTSFSAPTISGVVALMLEKNPALSNADATFGTLGNPASWAPGDLEERLEGSATDIPPDNVTITVRTGDPAVACWELSPPPTACSTLEATGHGWVFVDDALTAAGP